MNILNDKLKKEIKDYALSNPQEEVCALIVKSKELYNLYKCRNISFHKKENVILNPFDYIKAAREGDIVAHVHSQPKGKPSFTDYINAINHNIHSIMYSINLDKFYIIEPKLKDYLNKDYICGESDCYTLVRNYFNKELNIQLNDYNRQEGWWEKEPNLILENFKRENGIEIEYKDLKENDLILFKLNGRPSHFSIYLGNNFILHHPINSKSLISEVTDSLKKRICIIIRHKDLFI